jgi:hypothetical protein
VSIQPTSTKRLKIWASLLEDGTRRQAEVSSSMPFIHPHLALMPDGARLHRSHVAYWARSTA